MYIAAKVRAHLNSFNKIRKKLPMFYNLSRTACNYAGGKFSKTPERTTVDKRQKTSNNRQ